MAGQSVGAKGKEQQWETARWIWTVLQKIEANWSVEIF